LSKGQYLNVYDIGFDFPEAHVIKKDQKFYYAFYTHPWKQLDSVAKLYRFGSSNDYDVKVRTELKFPVESFSGKLELRGLAKNKKYRVADYTNHRQLGSVSGNDPWIKVSFENYLLLEVSLIK
jgi:alpha-galactosidase